MIRCTLSFCRKFVCAVLGCCLVVSAGTAFADSKAAKSTPASKAEAKAKIPTPEEAMMAEMMKFATPSGFEAQTTVTLSRAKQHYKMHPAPVTDEEAQNG